MTLSLGASSLSAQVAPPSGIPTITFCEMVKNPQLYFDKTVRLTAMFSQATEAQYLSDERCPLTHDEQIGVGHTARTEKEVGSHSADLRKLRSIEYGGRANVIVIGVLRNVSRRAFAWYHYRFDIARFEAVAHVVVPYERVLQIGMTYRGDVRGDADAGLRLVLPVRTQEHYALRVEWTNLNEFLELKHLRNSGEERQIVFSVISDELKQMTERRWNLTIRCKVIEIA